MNKSLSIRSGKGTQLDREISEAEAGLRQELAAAFAVAFHLGWNGETLNHITLRIPGTDTFLMNPAGYAWDEMTPERLATVTFDRKIISHSNIDIAVAGFNFHSGILKTRSDLNCVIHTHAKPGLVASSLTDPLIIFDQSGCLLHGEVGYHAFEGFVNQADEVPRILSDLGSGHTLIMQNHGLLTVGATLAEAFGYMRLLIDACELQERTFATGRPFRPIPDALAHKTKTAMSRPKGTPQDDHGWQYFMRVGQKLLADRKAE